MISEKREAYLKQLEDAYYRVLALNAILAETSALKSTMERALRELEQAMKYVLEGGYVAKHPNGQEVFVERLERQHA